jgi:nitrous oxide reductase accessory protein NosL
MLLALVITLAGLAACSGDNNDPAAAPPAPSHSATAGVTASTSPSASPSPTANVPTSAAPRFPSGYPKVVNVTSLPSQVKNWYQIGGYTKAVALAPGVWTPLPPGATVDDAAASGPLDGYCASIKAYERQYLNGEERGGACW